MRIGFNVTPFQGGHSVRGIGSYTRNLLEELKKTDLEIVEFTDPNKISDVDLIYYPWFDLFFRTLRIGKIPTVVMVHDSMPLIFPKAYPSGIKGKINLIFQRRELKKAKLIVSNSETSKKDISKYLGINKDKIFTIPLAAGSEFRVLPEADKKKTKVKYNLPDQFLLYVGDANYVKNLPFLIKGFKEVKETNKFKDFKLVLVGGAFLNRDLNHPELASLQEVHELVKKNGLEAVVMMPGQIGISDLVGFYNLASLYIQPSLYEGFGIPVLEAMQCNCPVLCSDGGSLPEVGGKAVEYFDPVNLGELVSKMVTVLTDQELRSKLAKKGFKQAEKFSWSITAKETINVFKKTLDAE